MPFDPGSVALGKKLGRVEDPRTLQLQTFMLPRSLRPTPPSRWRIAESVDDWPILGNDRYGCCTFAANGHRIIAQERSARQREVRVTEADVLAGYSAVTGFDPAKPFTDNGAYMLDVCNHMRRSGIGKEKDGSPHTIGAFVAVDPQRRDLLQLAAWMFGGVYVGLWLPNSAASQEVWDVPEQGPTGEGEPGSWGGHAVEVVGYTSRRVKIVTWGAYQDMTWDFFHVYADEAYAVISEDFLHGTGRTPQGFNTSQLTEALAAL